MGVHALRKLLNSRWLWGAIVVGLGLVLLAIFFLHYTSPAFVKGEAEAAWARTFTSEMRVGDARVQALRGVELYDVRIAREGGGGAEIAIDRVRCDWNAAAFLHGEMEPRRLVFIRPRVRLALDENGRPDLEELFRPKRSAEGARSAAPDDSAFERYFSEGIFIESGEAEMIAPMIFGDRQRRTLKGIDATLRRPSETLFRWDLAARVRGEPFHGARIEGWLDLTPGSETADFTFNSLPIPVTEDLLSRFPAGLRKGLSAYAFTGSLSYEAFLGYRRDRPLEYAFGLHLYNVDARLRTSGITARSVNAEMRFDREGFTCERLTGVLWDGALTAGMADRGGPGTAFVRVERAELAQMARELRIEERELRGLTDASVKFRWGEQGSPQGTSPSGAPWTAEGAVQISNAHLARLPLLANVFAFLKFQFPRGEVFDRGEAHFAVMNNKVYFENLSVSSPSAEITGAGEIGFDQTVDLVLLIASADREPGWLLTRPLRAVIQGLERTVSPPVSVTGPLSNPEVKVLVMEPITRPLRYLRDMLPFVGSSKDQK